LRAGRTDPGLRFLRGLLPALAAALLPACGGVGGRGASTVRGLPPPSTRAAAVRKVEAALSRLEGTRALRHARLGFWLQAVDEEAPLAQRRGTEGFLPASNLKLISSAVALLVHGRAFRYHTKLEAHGPIEGGRLRGDLVLVGDGDPTLGALAFSKEGQTAVFERMAASLKKAGILEVSGDVLGLDDCQPDEIMGEGWDWSYQSDWYAAQISGLCFNENCIDLIFDGTAEGMAPRIRLEPDTEYVTIRNKVRCRSGGPKGVFYRRRRGTNRILVTGSLSPKTRGKRDWASVENPTAFAATVLAETLVRSGVKVRGKALDADESEGWKRGKPLLTVHDHPSPTMGEILVSMNRRSQNLYAEEVLRSAARLRLGEGSMKAARRAAEAVLRGLGLDTEGLHLADGSGLSRLNRVEPRHLGRLLVAMAGRPEGAFYRSTLPAPGEGTLRRRFGGGSPARGRLRAKTGTLSRVVALSGYFEREGRAPMAFVILVNGFLAPSSEVRAAVDRFLEEILRLFP